MPALRNHVIALHGGAGVNPDRDYAEVEVHLAALIRRCTLPDLPNPNCSARAKCPAAAPARLRGARRCCMPWRILS